MVENICKLKTVILLLYIETDADYPKKKKEKSMSTFAYIYTMIYFVYFQYVEEIKRDSVRDSHTALRGLFSCCKKRQREMYLFRSLWLTCLKASTNIYQKQIVWH